MRCLLIELCVLFTTKPCSTHTICDWSLYFLIFVWYANFIDIENPIVVFIMIVVWNFRPLAEEKCHAVWKMIVYLFNEAKRHADWKMTSHYLCWSVNKAPPFRIKTFAGTCIVIIVNAVFYFITIIILRWTPQIPYIYFAFQNVESVTTWNIVVLHTP